MELSTTTMLTTALPDMYTDVVRDAGDVFDVEPETEFMEINPFVELTRNATSLLAYLRNLTLDDRQLLYAHMGVSSEIELLCSLPQKGLGDDAMATTVGVDCYEQQLMQYDLYRVQKHLLACLPPIIIVLGTFGNIFSFFILRRKAMLKFSTYFYLMVLALADTLVLYIGLLPLWTRQISGYDIFIQSDWLCKLYNVFGYTVSDFSVWLIIAVTCERYVVVYYPLKATSICDTTRAKRVISVILLLLLACNAHFLWTVKVVEYTHDGDTVLRCSGTAQHAFVIDHVWPWVDAMLYSLLPFVIITVVNLLIVRRIVRAHRHRDDLLRTGSVTSQQRPPPQANEGSTRMTIMLLIISFTFLLTTLPRTIAGIAAAFYNQYRRDLGRVAAFEFAHTVTDLLMYVNHSMNFFLYCATGQKFRRQLVWMLCYARGGSSVGGEGGRRRRGKKSHRLMRKLICEVPSCAGGGLDAGLVASPAGCGGRNDGAGGSGQSHDHTGGGSGVGRSPAKLVIRKIKGDVTEMYAMVRPPGLDNDNYAVVDNRQQRSA